MKAFTLVAVLAGVLAGPVLACGDDWMGVNLAASPAVKRALAAPHRGEGCGRRGGGRSRRSPGQGDCPALGRRRQ